MDYNPGLARQPPDMDPRPLPALNPERAIWDRNLPELIRALDAGWVLPRARTKGAGMVEDLSLAIRVVSLRWVEGWQVLARHFPALRASPVLWTLALRRAVPGVVEDLLAHGQSATRELENGLLPLHAVGEAMGSMPGEPIEEADLVATARALVRAGANLSTPYPGSFAPGDLGPPGHTLWTRAVYFGRWEMAEAFQPPSWEELLALPRGLEMVDDLRRAALAGSSSGALRSWVRIMGQWAGAWMAKHPGETFAQPADLAALVAMPAALRSQVWQRWAQADATGWTGLHDLALSGALPLAHQALGLAVADGLATPLAWSAPDVDGTRPCDLWELANRRSPSCLPQVDPASLPELAAD